MKITSQARKLLLYAAVGLALLGVFLLYTQPLVMIALADQIWACFR